MDGRRVARAALALALLLLARAMPWRPAPDRPTAEPPDRGAARLLWGLALDLNREKARDFEVLPGIGPTRAAAIVAGRPYCAVEDLDRVHGIGPSTLRRLAGQITVGAAPPAICRFEDGH